VPPANQRVLRAQFLAVQALHQAGRLGEAEAGYRAILGLDPRHADALHLLGLVALQRGHAEQCVRLIEQALAIRPRYPEALANLGHGYAELGQPAEALACFEKALVLRPDMAEAHDSRGTALQDLGRFVEALASHDRAAALRPNDPGAFNNRGNTLRALQRNDEALVSYDRAVSLDPDFVEALCNRATLLHAMERREEALGAFDAILARHPDHAPAYEGRGNVLRDLRRPDAAVASFARAIALARHRAEAHDGLGNALQDLGRYQEALESHAQAIALRPGVAEPHNNHGTALYRLQQFDGALKSLAQAIALRPDYAEAYYNRGNTLGAIYRMEAALADYAQALCLRPDYADAWRAQGLTQVLARQDRLALESFRRALTLRPDMDWLAGDIAFAARRICDWTSDAPDVADLEERIRRGERAAVPFVATALSGSRAVLRRAAEIFSSAMVPPDNRLGPIGQPQRRDKIRIAYVSADFRDHPTMHLMAGVFEHHDRSSFELTALSLGPDTGDAMLGRVRRTFDRFLDARLMPDAGIAEQARNLGVDIAIDLLGYVGGHRTGIFAARAAPVQAQYLGFPGTMGCPFIDYIIADPVILPPGAETDYSEAVIRLPDSYQANDRTRPIDAGTLTRRTAGLPDDGFVFCCFNSNYKITPSRFDGWMRILSGVPGSVLWLFADSPDAADNLRAEAEHRDISADRLIFASRQPLGQHLARQRLADLFLDTLPYNAHTTASDALWAGLPVLTQVGDSFAGRVAASLLHAVGLPELITTSDAEYEALAVTLATTPGRLQTLRNRIAENRLNTPLFDTERFTRRLETAFRRMHERAVAGLPPAPLDLARFPDPP
jgi:protein O-GlcNAc transferase